MTLEEELYEAVFRHWTLKPTIPESAYTDQLRHFTYPFSGSDSPWHKICLEEILRKRLSSGTSSKIELLTHPDQLVRDIAKNILEAMNVST